MKKYEKPEINLVHVNCEGLLGTISQGTSDVPIAPDGTEAGAKENEYTSWEDDEDFS